MWVFPGCEQYKSGSSRRIVVFEQTRLAIGLRGGGGQCRLDYSWLATPRHYHSQFATVAALK